MRYSNLFLAVALVIGLGCDDQVREKSFYADKKAVEAVSEPAAPAVGQKEAVEEAARKIIYTAQIELVADDFGKAEHELTQIVKDQDAYIAKSDTHGSPGVPRSGIWTIRVPAKRLDDLRDALTKLGEVRQDRKDSDDITDQYYDLKAHIKNDQVEEESLQKLMTEKSATGKLEDLLAVRREMRDIRGKIEAQQGRMQRWDKEVALSTVTLKITDRKDYVAPTTPHFGTTIGRTFGGSVDALTSFGQGIVLVAVAVTPWLPVVAIIVAPVWLTIRRMRKPASPEVATVIPAEPPAAG